MAAKEQECMIIGASLIEDRRIFDEYNPENYFVICADAGYETALKYKITPDLVVGDFDSATKKPSDTTKLITLPREKDVTDTMFAVMKGITHGCHNFVLLGCLGGARFDHSIANLEVLQFIQDHGGRGVLADDHTRVFLLKDGRLRMTGTKGATVSVFPYNGASCNVSYTGLQYPLNHETLTCGGTLMGVSNCIVDETAEIRVHSGTAMVIVYQP